MAKITKKRGRPRTGPEDSRVSDYPRVMLRLSPDVATQLKAWSVVRDRPVWRLIEEAVLQGIKAEPAEIRDLVRKVAQRRQAGPRDE
jgi:hypothetical protein